jgi:hypothetical protein
MEIKLHSPENWSEITTKQYVELLQAIEVCSKDDEVDYLKLRMEQAKILNPNQPVEKLTIPQIKEYFNSIKFLDERPVLELCNKITVDGKMYEFIQFKNMSMEQWIDSEKYSSLDMAHKLIAIFYMRPDDYNEIDLDKVSDHILNGPVTKFFFALSIFLFIHHALELHTRLFSERVEQDKKMIQNVKDQAIKIDQKIKRFQTKLSGFKFWNK